MVTEGDEDDGEMFDEDLMEELGLKEEDVKTTPRPGVAKSGAAAPPPAPPSASAKPVFGTVPGASRPLARSAGPSVSGAAGMAAKAPIGSPAVAPRTPGTPPGPAVARPSAADTATKAPVPPPSAPSSPPPDPADLSEHNLTVSQEIPMQLAAVLAKQAVKLKDILAFRVGDVMDFKKGPQDPVDLVANGKLVAKAELVMVDGKMGVRILKLVR
jgi:flagellar motor switch protein FliN